MSRGTGRGMRRTVGKEVSRLEMGVVWRENTH
jgi:hypothetical protein